MEGVTDRKCGTEGCENKRHGLDQTGFCTDCRSGGAKGKKPKKGKPAKAAKKAARPAKEESMFVVPLDVSELHLDRFWQKLTIEEKGLAIQTVLDNPIEA